MPDTNLPPVEPSTTTRSKGRTTESASLAKTDGARKLHFVLQGKGGVGKTMAALLLSQVIADKGEPVICIDTDPGERQFLEPLQPPIGPSIHLQRQQSRH